MLTAEEARNTVKDLERENRAKYKPIIMGIIEGAIETAVKDMNYFVSIDFVVEASKRNDFGIEYAWSNRSEWFMKKLQDAGYSTHRYDEVLNISWRDENVSSET